MMTILRKPYKTFYLNNETINCDITDEIDSSKHCQLKACWQVVNKQQLNATYEQLIAGKQIVHDNIHQLYGKL